jgi:hypothetical protein
MKKSFNKIVFKIIIISSLCHHFFTFGQTYKGMYIDDFNIILGNQNKEDSLFAYIQTNQFSAVSLYDLHQIDLTQTSKRDELKSFISHLKTNLNVIDVIAVAENFWFFENKIIPYNIQVTDNEKFTVFNLEFEFWVPDAVANYYCSTYLQPNGYTCDEAGAFDFYMSELNQIRTLCLNNNLKTEIYLGWFNQNQANEMVLKVDRILLSNYNTNPTTAFDNTLGRLQYIGNTAHQIDVAGLFSAEPEFLQTWLLANNSDLDSAFQIYQEAYNSETGTWKNTIDLVGHHWFTYSVLPYVLPDTTIIGAGLNEISNENNILFPNPCNSFLNLKKNHKNVQIFNFKGEEMKHVIKKENNKINVKHLESGLYFIKLDDKWLKFEKD